MKTFRDATVRIDAAILSMAEEDFCGLWEVLWRLREMFPQQSHGEISQLGRNFVSRLLKEKAISVDVRDGIVGEVREAHSQDFENIIDDTCSWNEPPHSNSPQILIGSKE